MSEYNMPPIGLFGKRCRIKHVSDLERGFVYRIVNSGVRSNCWKELPLGRYGKEAIRHDNMEDIVYVVCDTLIDENSKIERVALKDIEILEQEPILDKIRAEIEEKYGNCDICEYFEDYDYEENDISEYRPIGNIADVLQIIDKYRKEHET